MVLIIVLLECSTAMDFQLCWHVVVCLLQNLIYWYLRTLCTLRLLLFVCGIQSGDSFGTKGLILGWVQDYWIHLHAPLGCIEIIKKRLWKEQKK